MLLQLSRATLRLSTFAQRLATLRLSTMLGDGGAFLRSHAQEKSQKFSRNPLGSLSLYRDKAKPPMTGGGCTLCGSALCALLCGSVAAFLCVGVFLYPCTLAAALWGVYGVPWACRSLCCGCTAPMFAAVRLCAPRGGVFMAWVYSLQGTGIKSLYGANTGLVRRLPVLGCGVAVLFSPLCATVGRSVGFSRLWV